MPQFNSSVPKLMPWMAGISKLNWLLAAIFSQSSSTAISKDSLNSNSESYFTTGALLPIILSWCQDP
jgi:hypothetical protein